MLRTTEGNDESILIRAARRASAIMSRLLTSSPPERHENPFATLLPVLTALATEIHVQRAIEFGCGTNSTLSFLSKDVFPELIQLTSVENDAEWRDMIAQQANDSRLSMISVDGPVASAVSESLVRGNQIVLVDDSTCAQDRADTIRAVVRVLPLDSILVIHDFEVIDYQEASAELPYRLVCNTLLPNTGILSHRPILSERWFRRVNRTIGYHAKSICLTDTHQWHQQLRRL